MTQILQFIEMKKEGKDKCFQKTAAVLLGPTKKAKGEASKLKI